MAMRQNHIIRLTAVVPNYLAARKLNDQNKTYNGNMLKTNSNVDRFHNWRKNGIITQHNCRTKHIFVITQKKVACKTSYFRSHNVVTVQKLCKWITALMLTTPCNSVDYPVSHKYEFFSHIIQAVIYFLYQNKVWLMFGFSFFRST